MPEQGQPWDGWLPPILACPNDPDNVTLQSAVAGERIDEVFIGSCMTNIGHYRAAAKVLEGQGTNAAVFSTSTRNFNNRLGNGA